MDGTRPIVDLLNDEPTAGEGRLVVGDAKVTWSSAKLQIASESLGLRTLGNADGYVLQVNRAFVAAERTFADTLWGRPARSVGVVTLELRDGNARLLTLSAVAANEATLASLPDLGRVGPLVRLDRLVSLMQTARALGCTVAGWGRRGPTRLDLEHDADTRLVNQAPEGDEAFADRRLCPDSCCVGTIDPETQRCTWCGRSPILVMEPDPDPTRVLCVDDCCVGTVDPASGRCRVCSRPRH